MRVHQIVEADLPKFELPNITQGSGPSVDMETKIKVTPGGRGSFKLEYPDGRKETARSKAVLDKKIKAEKIRLDKLQKTTNKTADLKNKQAQKAADAELKQAKKDLKASKGKIKQAFKDFLKKNAGKGGLAGLIAALILQVTDGGIDEVTNHLLTLRKLDCKANHSAVKQSRIRVANQIAEVIQTMGATAIAAPIVALGMMPIVAIFGAIPFFGWIGGLISFVGIGAVGYVIAEWLRTKPSGRRWLAEQLYYVIRDSEGYVCDAFGWGESFVADDTVITEEDMNDDIKADVKDIMKNLPPKVKAKFKKGIKQAKQAAS